MTCSQLFTAFVWTWMFLGLHSGLCLHCGVWDQCLEMGRPSTHKANISASESRAEWCLQLESRLPAPPGSGVSPSPLSQVCTPENEGASLRASWFQGESCRARGDIDMNQRHCCGGQICTSQNDTGMEATLHRLILFVTSFLKWGWALTPTLWLSRTRRKAGNKYYENLVLGCKEPSYFSVISGFCLFEVTYLKGLW